MHTFIAWFARNGVTPNLIMVFIFLAGGYSLYKKIPLEFFPKTPTKYIDINISYPGATPKAVENNITILVEEAIYEIDGIKDIESRSFEGRSQIRVEVFDSYNQDEITNIKQTIDEIISTLNLPKKSEKPIVKNLAFNQDVISVAISSKDLSEKELRKSSEAIRNEIVQLESVTKATLQSVRPYEIAIELYDSALLKYKLTIESVAQIISANSFRDSVGKIKSQSNELLLSINNEAQEINEFLNIIILTEEDGTIIRLGDIAKIHDGFEETPTEVLFNGQPAYMIRVYAINNQSSITIADQIKKYINKKQATLPTTLQIEYWRDHSKVVKQRLSTLLNNAWQGIILVLLILSLFLHPKIAFWVCMGIPITFFGTFIIMPYIGTSLNVISLFSFILVLGIVVDDAIITGENVYKHLAIQKSSLDAAIKGTQEVAVPVTFGVLTTVLAFCPLFFIGGFLGEIYKHIPLIIIPVLLCSLFESKFILPSHLKHIRLRSPLEITKNPFIRFQQAFASGFEKFTLFFYKPLLRFCLQQRYFVFTVFIAISVFFFSLLISGEIKFIFSPRVEREEVFIDLKMETGIASEITRKETQQILQSVKEVQEKYRNSDGNSAILNVLSTIQQSSAHITVALVAADNKNFNVKASQISQEIRDKVGEIPGSKSLTYRFVSGRGGNPNPIQISLMANNERTLLDATKKVKEKLKEYQYIFDIHDSYTSGKSEIVLSLSTLGEQLGINVAHLSKQVKSHFYGVNIQRLIREGDDIRVVVRSTSEKRNSLDSLKNLQILLDNGTFISLSEIATIRYSTSPSVIERSNRKRYMSISADMNKQEGNALKIREELNQYLNNLKSQYLDLEFELVGEGKEMQETFANLIIGMIFVFLGLYSLLAIPFRSYFQPFIVMSAIPFGITGAIIGHYLLGRPMTMVSTLGMLALLGIVVNDSLVLVDYINKQKESGVNILESIANAGVARFRAVILTSLTTFSGLLPLLFETSRQAQLLIPMAISVAFGVLYATMTTLLLIPTIYRIVEDLKRLFRSYCQI